MNISVQVIYRNMLIFLLSKYLQMGMTVLYGGNTLNFLGSRVFSKAIILSFTPHIHV